MSPADVADVLAVLDRAIGDRDDYAAMFVGVGHRDRAAKETAKADALRLARALFVSHVANAAKTVPDRIPSARAAEAAVR